MHRENNSQYFLSTYSLPGDLNISNPTTTIQNTYSSHFIYMMWQTLLSSTQKPISYSSLLTEPLLVQVSGRFFLKSLYHILLMDHKYLGPLMVSPLPLHNYLYARCAYSCLCFCVCPSTFLCQFKLPYRIRGKVCTPESFPLLTSLIFFW